MEVPESLKAAVPRTTWGRILTATPIVMTILATALAGLASSEMTRAQYRRSLAAQQQSKAGDQWSLFQAKRVRGTSQRTALDILEATSDVRPLDAAAVMKALPALESAPGQQALAALQAGNLPAPPAGPGLDPKVATALEAVENSKPERDVTALLAEISDKSLDDALDVVRDRALALDATLRPINRIIDDLEVRLVRQASAESSRSGPAAALRRDVTVARLRYTALRYDAEARLNQAIANVYELQVRKSNIEAERLHTRSQRFFYGMLATQAGVIVSTFAIAARQRNALWWLAAGAGVAAVAYAAYVYLAV
jgi:Domain of unknown function (DUF4337)